MQPDNTHTEPDDEQEKSFPPGARELPEGGAPTTDPYTPEPGPRAGERTAFRALTWAWLAVLIVVAIVVWAILR